MCIPGFCPRSFFSNSMDCYISFESTFQELSNEPKINKFGWVNQKFEFILLSKIHIFVKILLNTFYTVKNNLGYNFYKKWMLIQKYLERKASRFLAKKKICAPIVAISHCNVNCGVYYFLSYKAFLQCKK